MLPLTEQSAGSVEIMLKLPRCPTLTSVQTFAGNVICPFDSAAFFHSREMTAGAAVVTVPPHIRPGEDRCLGMKC